MTKERKRIIITIFSVIAASFLAVFLFVHFFMNGYTYNRIAESIQAMEEGFTGENDDWWETAWDSADMVQVFVLGVDKEFNIDSDIEDYDYFHGEDKVIKWCRNNLLEDDAIKKADIDSHIYYVSKITSEEDSNEIYLFVVDGTSIHKMTSIIERVLFFIMLFFLIVAAVAGYVLGISIEKERDRQRGFFENASHELKTPLMSIRGYAEGIRNGVVHDEKHGLSVILRESDKMSGLVDDIFALSKSDRGVLTLSREKVSVAEIVGDCLESLHYQMDKKQIVPEVEIDDSFIEADYEKLSHAIMNILANAVRYADRSLKVSCKGKVLSVWDDGRQITDDERNNMFNRFYKGKDGSTGIGLALSKEILLLHKYDVSVRNHENGVEFLITLF